LCSFSHRGGAALRCRPTFSLRPQGARSTPLPRPASNKRRPPSITTINAASSATSRKPSIPTLPWRRLLPCPRPSRAMLRGPSTRRPFLLPACGNTRERERRLPSSDELSHIQRIRCRRLPLPALEPMKTLQCTQGCSKCPRGISCVTGIVRETARAA